MAVPRKIGTLISRKWYMMNLFRSEKPLVLVDVDGTTAIGQHREHFVSLTNGRTKKDWYAYFTEMVYDEPIPIGKTFSFGRCGWNHGERPASRTFCVSH